MDKNSEENLAALVGALVDSYRANPDTRHIDTGELPSREAAIDIIHDLRELLFPGYFGRQYLSSSELRDHVASLLESIREELTRQIERAILHRSNRDDQAARKAQDESQRIVSEFLHTIPDIRNLLGKDATAAFTGDPSASGIDEIIFCYPGYFAITVYRLAHELHLRGVPLLPRIMSEYAHSVTGIDIHPGANIGEFFFIDHGTGVVIGETTIIGNHVKIYQGVTLGALSTRGGQSLRGAKRHPTLGHDVTVYSGASILGGETLIGEGVVVSSNVFVTRSVPAHTRVTVKSPELQYRDQKPAEFQQPAPADWII